MNREYEVTIEDDLDARYITGELFQRKGKVRWYILVSCFSHFYLKLFTLILTPPAGVKVKPRRANFSGRRSSNSSST